ncbi:MAG: hypothetical protein WBM97_20725 [Sedimenticolaceae bacterium]
MRQNFEKRVGTIDRDLLRQDDIELRATFCEFRGVPGALTVLVLIEDAKEPSNEARFDQ